MQRFGYPYRTIKGDSADTAKQFEDKSCEAIFLDADHIKPSVLRDIRAWISKVKDGGIILGHDVGGEINPDHPGVRQALHEIFGNDFQVDLEEDVWFIEIDEYRERMGIPL